MATEPNPFSDQPTWVLSAMQREVQEECNQAQRHLDSLETTLKVLQELAEQQRSIVGSCHRAGNELLMELRRRQC